MASDELPTGVMKVKDYPNGDSYWRVACECSDPNHDAELWFEVDKEYGDMSLNMSMEIGFYPNWNLNRWDAFTRQLKTAIKVLFTGRFTTQGSLLLSEENVKALEFALTEGQKHARQVVANSSRNVRPSSTGPVVQ